MAAGEETTSTLMSSTARARLCPASSVSYWTDLMRHCPVGGVERGGAVGEGVVGDAFVATKRDAEAEELGCVRRHFEELGAVGTGVEQVPVGAEAGELDAEVVEIARDVGDAGAVVRFDGDFTAAGDGAIEQGLQCGGVHVEAVAFGFKVGGDDGDAVNDAFGGVNGRFAGAKRGAKVMREGGCGAERADGGGRCP